MHVLYSVGKLLLPTTDTVTVVRRGFYYACTATWNCLSPHLTDMSTDVIVQFQKTVEDIVISLVNIEH